MQRRCFGVGHRPIRLRPKGEAIPKQETAYEKSLVHRVQIYSGMAPEILERRSLFPFRKRSLPFLTVDTTISNQPSLSSHDRCNIFPGLSYKKAKNMFSNSVKKNDVGAQVEFSLKCTKRARVTCY